PDVHGSTNSRPLTNCVTWGRERAAEPRSVSLTTLRTKLNQWPPTTRTATATSSSWEVPERVRQPRCPPSPLERLSLAILRRCMCTHSLLRAADWTCCDHFPTSRTSLMATTWNEWGA